MLKFFIIILTAASPISELRGAIPLGIFVYKMEPWIVLLLALIGNILPVIILLPFFQKMENLLKEKSHFFKNFFLWLNKRTYEKFLPNFDKYKKLALLIFVAIPFPLTGAWTGSLAAVLFNIPKKDAFLLISSGIVIAGIIVLLLSVLGNQIF